MKNLLFFFIILLTGCNILHHSTGAQFVTSDGSDAETDYTYNFTEGTKFKLLNNTNLAINLFFKCITLNPQKPAPYYQLSEIYLNMGDLDRALFFSRKSVTLDAKNSWYLLQLARIYQERGSIDSTILIYRKIVDIKPSKYEVNFNLALLYLQNKEPKKTIQILNDLKRKYGNNDEIILTLFKVYSQAKEHRDCIRVLKEAIKLYPEDVRFFGLLAEYYVNLRDFENALLYYNKLLEIDPDNEKCLLSLIEYYRIVHDYPKLSLLSRRYVSDTTFLFKNKVDIIGNLIADQNFLGKSSETVLELIQRLDTIYNNDFRINTLYTDFYLKTKNYIQARDKLSYLVSNYQTTMPFWEQLIFVLSSLNEYSKIPAYCDHGIEIFGNKPFFYLYKGVSLYHLRKFKDAADVLEVGLKYASTSNDLRLQFYTYLGECSNTDGEYARSDSFFVEALKLDPHNLYILNNYSFYLAQRGERLDFASEYIKTCLNTQPDSYTYLDTYGWILFKMGKVENSRKVLEVALRNGGQANKEILEHYVFVLYALGQIDDAKKYYKLITELGEPSHALNVLFKN
jgi:tetratricopeptide (TPR) repeat protein